MSRCFMLGYLAWSFVLATRVLGFVLHAPVPSGCRGVVVRDCSSSSSSASDRFGAGIIQGPRHVAACRRSSPQPSMMSDDFDEDGMSFGEKAMQERTNAELQGMVDSHNIIAFIKVKCTAVLSHEQQQLVQH